MKRILRLIAGKAGLVYSILCISGLSYLSAQQDDSALFSREINPVVRSKWMVNAFGYLPYHSVFSMDSITTLRGIVKGDFEQVDRWTEFNDDGKIIIVYESGYDRLFLIPFQASLEWYVGMMIYRNRIHNLMTQRPGPGEDAVGIAAGEGFEIVAVETQFGTASLTVNGNVNLTGKLVFQDQELTRSNFRESQTTHFEFDETQQIVVQGKVGDRVNVDLNYNSERDFDFENNIKINYTGTEDEIVQKIEEFFSDETRDEYIRYGIPYKNVFLLYGVPGSGKTSTIRTIASYLDCNVYVIPISKELTDYGLIDAISYLEENEEKKRIIVIEDIDCIFTERKKGDDINGISLQGLLNCFDGFSCVEGTLLFLTANKPEVLDQAMIRSCRIDHKYCLDYADKYQTEKIFTMIMKDKKELFDKFYSKIESREYTTAMLQEFLFFNRKNDTFMDSIKDFYKIIEKNNLKSLTNDSGSNVYM